MKDPRKSKIHSFYAPQRKRCQIDCSTPILTDQSDAKMADINNIMAQYAKTGLLPNINEHIASYQDNTLAIPLEEAHNILTAAKVLFMELPAQIRKLMDNDPTQLQSFLNNPDNQDILIKHKMLESKKPLLDREPTKTKTDGSTLPKVEKTPVKKTETD